MLLEDMMALGQAGAVRDLERIRAAGQHQLILVNDILDISKIEAGRLGVIEPLAHKNCNRLECEAEPDLGTVECDVTKVRQILYNLLSNACKFTKNGNVKLTARRRESHGRAELEFVVSDTGIGMAPAVVENLFQPFTQADASTTRIYGGSGLGLALTKHFCRLLGGTIRLESAPGLGSTYMVTLPAGMSAAAACPDVLSSRPPAVTA